MNTFTIGDRKDRICEVVKYVSRQHLEEIIEFLNEQELDDEEEQEEKLTVEEVLSKPELLRYLVVEELEDRDEMFDPFEYWNADGWCEFRDYR